MRKFQDDIRDGQGAVHPNVTVTVYLAGSNTLATIYSDDGVTLKSNPFTPTSQGRVIFYAPDGRYDISVAGVNLNPNPTVFSDIEILDLTEGSSADSPLIISSLNGVLNANTFPGANMGAKVNAAIAALPSTGGEVRIPAGSYAGIATGIVINKPVRLIGAGADNTKLTFNAGVTGITIQLAGIRSEVQGMNLYGTGGATADGINAAATHILRNVWVQGFSRNGVRVVASVPTGNANAWLHEQVWSLFNTGDGFYYQGTDVNVGTSIGCTSIANGGWGFNDAGGGTMNNTWITPNVSTNTLGGYQVAGNAHSFINPYTENEDTVKSSFVFTAATIGNRVAFPRIAQPLTITDAGSQNVIEWFKSTGGGISPISNRSSVGLSPNVTASPTLYDWNSGSFDTAALALSDLTNSKNLLAYYPATGFKFLRPVNLEYLLPGLTLTDTTVGGHSFAMQTGVYGGGIFSFSDQTAGVNHFIINPASTWPIQFLQNLFVNTGKVILMGGGSSGNTTFQAASVASGTITLPAATDTLVGKATTDVFTNKTFDTAGTGNSFLVNGTAITAKTGTGSVVLATTPTLVTPVLGAATGTSLNLGATGVLSTTATSGSGSLAMTTSPVFVTPTLGAASGTSLALTGKVGTYNNVATAGIGAVPIYGSIGLTGQTTTIAPANAYAAAPAGLYRVAYYVKVTTVGTAGTVTITISWNDGTAMSFTSPTASLLSTTSTGLISGDVIVKSAAGQNITYATTVAGATGSPQYSVDVTVEQLK